ncbi:hypothetical protein BGZ46_006566 [Entomortierella lignicola]|nr:hypothetical protein BGZ46_006566 [Entomortierella lignicola]
MLASGSLYVYALYATSFTGHLGYSQTQTSIIAVIGDIGLYGVGPLSGFLADRLGPRATSSIAACLLGLGYCLLSIAYSNGLDSVARGQPPPHFLLMAFYLSLAGMGSSASYMAAFTSLANNFVHARGAALELDTGRFLLFLGLFGGSVNVLSVLGLKILSPEYISDHTTNDNSDALSTDYEANEQTQLLEDSTVTVNINSQHRVVPSVSGKAFLLNRDAQYFALVKFCLSGTGLMIINSISAMIDAVAAAEDTDSGAGLYKNLGDKSPISAIHAYHVMLISLASYTGRLVFSLGSDIAIHRYGALRIQVLPIATACMALAQVVGMFAPLRWLHLCSALTGIAYGGFFGVAGTIVAELWGPETCGQNWGWMSWGAAFGGMLFNVLFGVVMDAERPIVDGRPQVCKGHGCFRTALIISFSACVLSCGISLLIVYRQKRANGQL